MAFAPPNQQHPKHTYINEIVHDMRTLQHIQMQLPEHCAQLRHTHELLCRELSNYWHQQHRMPQANMMLHSESTSDTGHLGSGGTDASVTTSTNTSENNGHDAGGSMVQHRIPIPDRPGINFIGRIVGPRGITVKQMEEQFGCKIMVRGRGSVKSPERERRLCGRPGWEHLHEPLHVLVTCQDRNPVTAQRRVDHAVQMLRTLLSDAGDTQLKRVQLMELAIINGTYRPASFERFFYAQHNQPGFY